MSYLEEKEPPRREDRLCARIAGGGEFGQTVRKLRCCQTDGERSFSQNSICLLLPAMGIMNTIPDSVVLLHGAVGCGSSAHGGNAGVRSGHAQRWGVPRNGTWASTALGETEIIGGGEENLAQAITDIDERLAPKVIFVVAGCVPGIIGDDIHGVIEQLQPQVEAKLLAVHCEGFKTKIWATAYDAVYHDIARVLLPTEDHTEASQPQRPIVNVMNGGSMGRVDEVELERLLNALDLEANFFPVFTKPESFQSMKQASLSVSTCPTHDDYLLQHLKETYGVPYQLRHMPIGIRNTGEWLRSVGGHFGLQEETEALIAAEEAALFEALKPLQEHFAGKKVFVSAGEFRALSTAILLAELGLEVVAVRAYHHDEFAESEYEKLAAITKDDLTFNIANCQPYEEANLIQRIQPDLFLGHMSANSTAAKLGVATTAIYQVGLQFMGYQGAFQLARRVYRQLRNPNFNHKLRDNLRLPYRDSWYEQPPFLYLRQPEGGEE